MAILSIDRSNPFVMKYYTQKDGWSILEQDDRSLALTELDTAKIALRTTLCSDEKEISGEEALARSKISGEVRLDAAVFKVLLRDEFEQEVLETKKPGYLHTVFQKWLQKERPNAAFSFKADGTVLSGMVFFYGTIFLSPQGNRCVLCMYWRDGKCNYGHAELSFVKWTKASPHVFLEI